jgi:hypothetical protein
MIHSGQVGTAVQRATVIVLLFMANEDRRGDELRAPRVTT